ncbi:MAG: PHP domain-containing protein [Parachlamydia sp.]|jgi:hypothetical protein|nr:PHP domain-containing protein [Parachlamydia sp.]
MQLNKSESSLFRADLHCHTTHSDGTLTPLEMIEKAVQRNLKGLSITDHDTLSAYPEAIDLAAEKGLLLLPGVEFSASQQKTNVHILAYSFSIKNETIQAFCKSHQARRLHRNQEILNKLAASGMPLTMEDIQTVAPLSHSFGRPHIAAAMIEKGYVSSISQAFKSYIGEGKSCYAEGNPFSVEETLEVIHKAGGFAIIAHPHLIDRTKVVKSLLEMNFDGIEAYYARFPFKMQEKWVKIGQYRQWIITGGSDFHGLIKPHLDLGTSWVNEDTFMLLYNRYLKNCAC